MTDEGVTRIRQIATIDEQNAVATYEAVHGKEVLGTITKHRMADEDERQTPYRNCYWTHSLDNGCDPHETSADCIESLERAAGVGA